MSDYEQQNVLNITVATVDKFDLRVLRLILAVNVMLEDGVPPADRD